MKVSTDLVLRYCSSIDGFVAVRLFTEAEVGRVVGKARFRNRREYVRFLLSVCLPDFADQLLPELLGGEGGCPGELEVAEDALYAVCVAANPHLEIARVALPVANPGDRAELYLLDANDAPNAEMADGETFLALESILERQVVGQREAVEKLARILRRAAAGLRDPRKPVGSFFFLGQTGVGKTELAKTLARALYQGEERLVRIDCSEYSQPHEYAKLIGSPPGYIGHQEGGHLTDAVMAQGRSVVLFDEVEKAHPKVHQLLLQVLDEGTLTDNKGRKACFRDAVIIMTSNVGARDVEALGKRMGFGSETRVRDAEAESMKALRANFPPEFVNRIDEVVMFQPLGYEELLKICDLLLGEVSRYLEPKGLDIEFDAEVKEFLVREGTDPSFGARPLRRTIQRQVLDPLADQILRGRYRPPTHLSTHLDHGAVRFEAA